MANTAKFERQAVLKQATNLFWGKGYLATSTRELQQTLNMRPGSIYAAFGSKSTLFQLVLQHYAETILAEVRQTMNDREPLSALANFLERQILSPDSPCKLCLLIKTLSELGDREPETTELARSLLKQLEALFAEVLEHARLQHQLPMNSDCQALASDLQIQLIGLRGYLHMTGNREHTREMLKSFFDRVTQVTAEHSAVKGKG